MPEEAFLLHCLRCIVTGESINSILSLDWGRLYGLAAAHELVPILEATLPRGGLPPDVAEKVGRESRRRRMRAALMIGDFRALAANLGAAGIPVMPLKGIVLAHTVYPSVTLRYFDDIDLLVPSESAAAALEVLRQSGYVIHPRVARPDWHHLPPHVHSEHHTMVEIHTDLVRRARPGWDIDEIWDRARPGQLAGVEVYLMADQDALIYTALHARHNLFNRLSFMLDAALLARRLSPDAASQLSQLARQAGARCALAHLLGTAARLFGLNDLPGRGGRGLGCWTARRLAGWRRLEPGRTSLRQGPVPRALEMLLMDSLGDALRLAGRLLLPPTDFVGQGYGVEGGRVAGYWRRLQQRFRLAASQTARLLRGK